MSSCRKDKIVNLWKLVHVLNLGHVKISTYHFIKNMSSPELSVAPIILSG